MITKIQPYSINQNNYKPNFKAVIPQGHYISIKHRGKVLPENTVLKFFAQIKEIFFEIFPKLDPEYKKI